MKKSNFFTTVLISAALVAPAFADEGCGSGGSASTRTGFFVGLDMGPLSTKSSVTWDSPVAVGRARFDAGSVGFHFGPSVGYGKLLSNQLYVGLKASWMFAGGDSKVGDQNQQVKISNRGLLDINVMLGTFVKSSLVFLETGYGRLNYRHQATFLGKKKSISSGGWNIGLGTIIPVSQRVSVKLSGMYTAHGKKKLKGDREDTRIRPSVLRATVGVVYSF